jgi:hypothetical protein
MNLPAYSGAAFCGAQPEWRDGRVAEGARLESVYTRKGIQGSNPCLSASSCPKVRPFQASCLGIPVFIKSGTQRKSYNRALKGSIIAVLHLWAVMLPAAGSRICRIKVDLLLAIFSGPNNVPETARPANPLTLFLVLNNPRVSESSFVLVARSSAAWVCVNCPARRPILPGGTV